jgi:hypothetical protein
MLSVVVAMFKEFQSRDTADLEGAMGFGGMVLTFGPIGWRTVMGIFDFDSMCRVSWAICLAMKVTLVDP